MRVHTGALAYGALAIPMVASSCSMLVHVAQALGSREQCNCTCDYSRHLQAEAGAAGAAARCQAHCCCPSSSRSMLGSHQQHPLGHRLHAHHLPVVALCWVCEEGVTGAALLRKLECHFHPHRVTEECCGDSPRCRGATMSMARCPSTATHNSLDPVATASCDSCLQVTSSSSRQSFCCPQIYSLGK